MEREFIWQARKSRIVRFITANPYLSFRDFDHRHAVNLSEIGWAHFKRNIGILFGSRIRSADGNWVGVGFFQSSAGQISWSQLTWGNQQIFIFDRTSWNKQKNEQQHYQWRSFSTVHDVYYSCCRFLVIPTIRVNQLARIVNDKVKGIKYPIIASFQKYYTNSFNFLNAIIYRVFYWKTP